MALKFATSYSSQSSLLKPLVSSTLPSTQIARDSEVHDIICYHVVPAKFRVTSRAE
jgi:hypothetical protein